MHLSFQPLSASLRSAPLPKKGRGTQVLKCLALSSNAFERWRCSNLGSSPLWGERLSWKSSPFVHWSYTSWFHSHWPNLALDGVGFRPEVSRSDCTGLGKWWSWPRLSRDLWDQGGFGLGSATTSGGHRRSSISSYKVASPKGETERGNFLPTMDSLNLPWTTRRKSNGQPVLATSTPRFPAIGAIASSAPFAGGFPGAA